MYMDTGDGGMALPDHVRTTIAQRQQQRTRIAHTVEVLLSETRLAGVTGHLVQTAIGLLQDDECDLNGTPGVRTAITVEREAWERLQQGINDQLRDSQVQQARACLDTIKRVIEVQATLIDLAIPDQARPLQALWDEYQQRYGKPTE